MSRQVEDEIRDSLRSEAARLRAVRPLRLPPEAAHPAPRRALRAPRLRLMRGWLVPAAVAAGIVLVAAALVTVRALTNPAGGRAISPGPVVGPANLGADYAGAPRYYVGVDWVTPPSGLPTWAIVVGDGRTGKRVGLYSLGKRGVSAWAASGAADDRTFVVSAGVRQWYLVRIFPGSGYPVRVTRLAVHLPATSAATYVISLALSADGTRLAVVSSTGTSVRLGVYSVPSGELRHSWSAGISGVFYFGRRVADLSWVGDSTVGFAFIDVPEVSEEVRTLDVGSAGTALLAGSRVVWSQHVPPPVGGTSGESTPRACDTPFLTGDGRTVVCAASSYSATDKRLSALWLAYPLATPARPRVIGSVTEPRKVTAFDGPNAVEWVNPSGTEVIGTWRPAVSVPHGLSATDYRAVIGHGAVRLMRKVVVFDPVW